MDFLIDQASLTSINCVKQNELEQKHWIINQEEYFAAPTDDFWKQLQRFLDQTENMVYTLLSFWSWAGRWISLTQQAWGRPSGTWIRVLAGGEHGSLNSKLKCHHIIYPYHKEFFISLLFSSQLHLGHFMFYSSEDQAPHSWGLFCPVLKKKPKYNFFVALFEIKKTNKWMMTFVIQLTKCKVMGSATLSSNMFRVGFLLA